MEEAAYPLLEQIDTPFDLRKLPEEKLLQVCGELRDFIIDAVSCNPAHFGASLGVVELTVALHYVLNTPEDKIIWDVGTRLTDIKFSPIGASCSTPTVSTVD